jgi:flavin reductase (DIM6/NTAB) family NADH-FMN oxidoreductase RutF
MEFTPTTMPWRDRYKLLTGSIIPRPIAFVSTLSKNGLANAAPFSFFTAISADPMLVCFSPMRRGTDGAKKDTLTNIEETRQFVINIVSEEFAEKMNVCATEFSPDIDEFEASGLTKAPSEKIAVPRIKESKINFECELEQILHFGDNAGAGSLVIGRVVHVHMDDELHDRGRVLAESLQPIGRLAGNYYTRPLASTFELERIINSGDKK